MKGQQVREESEKETELLEMINKKNRRRRRMKKMRYGHPYNGGCDTKYQQIPLTGKYNWKKKSQTMK